MNLKGLNSLNEIVSNPDLPTDFEMVVYLFWDKGISLEEFVRLPIPYIISVLKSLKHVRTEEKRAMEKAQRRK